MDVLISNLHSFGNCSPAEGGPRRSLRRDLDGVYVVSPTRTNEHQEVCGHIFIAIEMDDRSDRHRRSPLRLAHQRSREQVEPEFPPPDVAAFLPGGPAICKKSHWLGGPDFAVEVISPHDRSRKKLDFYARSASKNCSWSYRSKPWALELYRLQDGKLVLVGKSDLDHPDVLGQRGGAAQFPARGESAPAEGRDRPFRRCSALVSPEACSRRVAGRAGGRASRALLSCCG